MKKSYNKAFTLVELLAVIVILAIILVIAVPKIMDVISSSKKSTLETSVKMIASAAEKAKMQNIVLGKEDEDITCSSVAKLNSNDYDLDNCTITFDTNNNASVTINGKGKFEGLSVCGGTKNNATAQTDECIIYTPIQYFTYELYAVNSSDIIVEDVDKCGEYFYNDEFYNGNCSLDLWKGRCENKGFVSIVPINKYDEMGVKLKDGAEIGVVITGYNMEGGTEVIVPNTIDGYKVIGYTMSTSEFTKFVTPDTVMMWVEEEFEGCPPWEE